MTPVSATIVPDLSATFHPFPRLPLEIRRMIWKAALPGPRNVALKRLDGVMEVVFMKPESQKTSWPIHDTRKEDGFHIPESSHQKLFMGHIYLENSLVSMT
ncbi:hypothetical protein BHYA_0036g00130 [Botrytis hyacinthi]|uniref:2EXR domain-containing protein n=1 Tax=Botrytis hyacinthi TaxID=278943 RepID=A0A4Z1GZH2_9HELO|nr:hypothetical protein BHYA_0036g00130 [Botrytis hyacinthi]